MATNSAKTNRQSELGSETVEVLYQKMGSKWFAFSCVDGEVLVGSITQDEIDMNERKQKAAPARRSSAAYRSQKLSGNS